MPDKLALKNTDQILDFIRNAKDKPNALFLFLISGGASALLSKPLEGISLEDKLKVIHLLASNGADINELNTVRISLSQVKGGKLVQSIGSAKVKS